MKTGVTLSSQIILCDWFVYLHAIKVEITKSPQISCLESKPAREEHTGTWTPRASSGITQPDAPTERPDVNSWEDHCSFWFYITEYDHLKSFGDKDRNQRKNVK